MIEINAFSIIMVASIVGLIPLAIWANKRDYAQIKELLKQWSVQRVILYVIMTNLNNACIVGVLVIILNVSVVV